MNQQKHGTCPISTSSPLRLSPSTSTSNEYQLLPENDDTDLLNTKCLSPPPPPTENSQQCDSDSDCADTLKCCFVDSRCPSYGRQCVTPRIVNALLPSIPYNLTITERKKGKTVILSWESTYNRQKPTMFVVEGQWSLSGSSDSISSSSSGQETTKWGYLAQTVNQNWVILRSINRGRWYRFRVAAISKLGSHGYSKPTDMFILSAQPKPPTQPENLTVVQVYHTETSGICADLTWLPSKRSDLPVIYYKLTWKLEKVN